MRKLLFTLALLALATAPALANMAGSTVTLIEPLLVDPGLTYTFVFEVCNGSPDGEATELVRFIFPEDSDVLAGSYDDLGQGWSFGTTIYGDWMNYIEFYDTEDDGVGEILPGTCGLFYVDVFIHDNMDCGINDLDWKQYGDGTGEIEHFIRDLIEFEVCGDVPTEQTTFSTVKSLY